MVLERFQPKAVHALKPIVTENGKNAYKDASQLTIDQFIFPYGAFDPNNRWARMAEPVPWDEAEKTYAKNFGKTGAPAHPARMALGALLIKQVTGCSDAALVDNVAENPYMQFFLGLREFGSTRPFGAPALAAFRKRFPDEETARINALVVERARKEAEDDGTGSDDGDGDDGGDGGDGNGNEGALVTDAAAAPSNIAFPTDAGLLSEARGKLEGMVDDLCAQTGAKRPRMRRNVARKDFLNRSESKRKSAKASRSARRRQLGCVKRDLGFIEALVADGAELAERQKATLEAIRRLCGQQLEMHEPRTRKAENRIVPIEQPRVRPVVRGKAHADTGFGAKVHLCIEDGRSIVERMSFDAHSESARLASAAESCFGRHGRRPERILADKIYLSRSNRAWCKERGIRLSGPGLGRPSKDAAAEREKRRVEATDAADRNCVEGSFGAMKRAYGMDRVMTRLKETTETVIALSAPGFNLKRLAALLHALIWQLVASAAMLLETLVEVGSLDFASWQVVGANRQRGSA